LAIIDWNDEATKAANYAAERRPADHHGAIPWGQDGHSAVFGNDAYRESEGAQITVGLLRQGLTDSSIEVLGAGFDSEACTWALIVRSNDLDRLRKLVTSAWQRAIASDPAELERELLVRMTAIRDADTL